MDVSRPRKVPVQEVRRGVSSRSTRPKKLALFPTMPNAYIVECVRTAGGKNGGRLRDYHPISLGAAVVDALVDRTGMVSDPKCVHLMGPDSSCDLRMARTLTT